MARGRPTPPRASLADLIYFKPLPSEPSRRPGLWARLRARWRALRGR